MKYLAVIALLVLAGCDRRPLDQREYTKTTLTNIPELSDCIYVKIDDIRIIRCPHSDTTVTYSVKQGKTYSTVVTSVIDGEKK
jgi:hypothetical protein